MSGAFFVSVLIAALAGCWAYEEPGVATIGLTITTGLMAAVIGYVAGRMP